MSVLWVLTMAERLRVMDMRQQSPKDRNPVIAVLINYTDLDDLAWDMMAELCSVAYVEEGDSFDQCATCYATKENMSVFRYGVDCLRSSKQSKNEILAALERVADPRYHPTLDAPLIAGRQIRANLNGIAHRVAGDYPNLRDWNRKDVEIAFVTRCYQEMRADTYGGCIVALETPEDIGTTVGQVQG